MGPRPRDDSPYISRDGRVKSTAFASVIRVWGACEIRVENVHYSVTDTDVSGVRYGFTDRHETSLARALQFGPVVLPSLGVSSPVGI